ncbi:MAG: hypothetical protein GAK43_02053 [Stenotrophomonas maltophilia]|nr:MAG: hypothetical protein GAK43_02053 [Stenotrophomonas maltophilia]
MDYRPSRTQLLGVLAQLSEQEPRSLAQLRGVRETNLLILRELLHRGLIKGVLRDDPLGAADAFGPLLCDAERLRLRLPYAQAEAQLQDDPLERDGLLRT